MKDNSNVSGYLRAHPPETTERSLIESPSSRGLSSGITLSPRDTIQLSGRMFRALNRSRAVDSSGRSIALSTSPRGNDFTLILNVRALLEKRYLRRFMKSLSNPIEKSDRPMH